MHNISDLEKARKIVAKRKSWIGKHGALQDNVADAVAEGIALGREEGLELAARTIRNMTPAFRSGANAGAISDIDSDSREDLFGKGSE
jgi:hypothetical protein